MAWYGMRKIDSKWIYTSNNRATYLVPIKKAALESLNQGHGNSCRENLRETMKILHFQTFAYN